MNLTTSVGAAGCRICEANLQGESFVAREMMFGLRHRFRYVRCNHCGSVQIAEIPENLADYYGPGYYSLVASPRRGKATFAQRALARLALAAPWAVADGLSRLLYRKTPFLRWVRLAGVGRDAAILDVGCGSGGLLRRMQRYGFSNLVGADPYAPAAVDEPGLRIVCGDLSSVGGRFDLVMFNHVLEHVPEPVATLRRAALLLQPAGTILVRIPVADSPLAREFGADWYNLDAPRHLSIPGRAGMELLAGRVGLQVVRVEFDTEEASLLHSENYRRNLALPEAAQPSRAERRRNRRLARDLNRRGEGDLGVYLLRRAIHRPHAAESVSLPPSCVPPAPPWREAG